MSQHKDRTDYGGILEVSVFFVVMGGGFVFLAYTVWRAWS